MTCACGRQYPIREYVLSFAALFPADLQREAAFWDRFYLWNLAQGAVGFHDLRRGFAPFLARGVREAFPFADTIDRYDVHYEVAEHPLLRAGHTLLDIGVGLGWTSIHFARAGYAVTAFDPSLGPLQAAKAYAIQEGLAIEYLCAAMGYVDFQPGCFDNVAAFHSLHHVPDLEAGLLAVRRWLRPDGGLAVDEHIANSRLAGALGVALHEWAAAEVFPALPHDPRRRTWPRCRPSRTRPWKTWGRTRWCRCCGACSTCSSSGSGTCCWTITRCCITCGRTRIARPSCMGWPSPTTCRSCCGGWIRKAAIRDHRGGESAAGGSAGAGRRRGGAGTARHAGASRPRPHRGDGGGRGERGRERAAAGARAELERRWRRRARGRGRWKRRSRPARGKWRGCSGTCGGWRTGA